MKISELKEMIKECLQEVNILKEENEPKINAKLQTDGSVVIKVPSFVLKSNPNNAITNQKLKLNGRLDKSNSIVQKFETELNKRMELYIIKYANRILKEFDSQTNIHININDLNK